jgi:hypothetical protein
MSGCPVKKETESKRRFLFLTGYFERITLRPFLSLRNIIS